MKLCFLFFFLLSGREGKGMNESEVEKEFPYLHTEDRNFPLRLGIILRLLAHLTCNVTNNPISTVSSYT